MSRYLPPDAPEAVIERRAADRAQRSFIRTIAFRQIPIGATRPPYDADFLRFVDQALEDDDASRVLAAARRAAAERNAERMRSLLDHRASLEAELARRRAVAASSCRVLDWSPPPGASIRSTPFAAHAPPVRVRRRCMSGPVRTLGATSLPTTGGS